MAFTRTVLYLKWDGGTKERAFYVLQTGYSGGHQEKPASYQRSLYDARLLAVRSPLYPRKFSGYLLGESSTSDSVGEVSCGTISDLQEAWEATDLQCKSFEDDSYWAAEWVGDWPPVLEYDPLMNYAVIPMKLEQKS